MVDGYPMFQIHAKLKMLKLELRKLNHSHYRDISNRVNLAKFELEDHQHTIHSGIVNDESRHLSLIFVLSI